MMDAPLNERQKTAALEQLAHILESEYFRGSHRCCQFLEYSVHYVLDRRPLDELKERTVGMEVFDRTGNYDTAQDNIVRVTATDMRKRLAQYYGHGHPDQYPRLQVPSGSYAVTFQWEVEDLPVLQAPEIEEEMSSTPADATPLEEIHRPRAGWKALTLGLLIVATLLATAATVIRSRNAADVVRRAWSPLLESRKPVIICISQPTAYRPSSGNNTLQGPQDQMVALPEAFVGVGDAYALAHISGLLSANKKDWELLTTNDTPSQTLLNGPIVLIGAYANKWIPDLMDNLRFGFGPGNVVYDRSKPNVKWSLKPVLPDWKTNEDYAIVSRFSSMRTGQPVIVIAGITNYGTQAAGEFITDQKLLSEAFRSAPKNWDHKNFEFVLHTKLIGDSPEHPTVVAAEYW